MSESIAKEKRTAVAWRQSCLKLLGAVHADYHWNRDVGGRCIEFVRTDASGLHLSYNFVRIREEYHLGFAVTLSLERSETVATAFAAGSRFDHNRTIWRLLAEDVGLSRGDKDYPPGAWSEGAWRDDTLELLTEGLTVPERHLYPRYVAALRAGKERLAAIFQRGEELCSAFGALVIDDEALLLRRASDLGLDTGSVPLLKTVVLIDAFRLAGAVPAKRYDGAEVDLTRVPLDAVVLAQLPLLYRHRASLADYARTVLAL